MEEPGGTLLQGSQLAWVGTLVGIHHAGATAHEEMESQPGVEEQP